MYVMPLIIILLLLALQPVASLFFNNLPSLDFGDSGFVSFLWSGCWMAIFPGISFFLSDYRYDRLVSDDGIMQLAQAGIYQGPDAIQEYGSFITERSPFLRKTAQEKIDIRYGGLEPTKKNNQCIFNVGITRYHLHDETSSAYAAEYYYPIMFKAFFPVGQAADRVNVYFAPGFFEQVFTRILDSDNTRRTICNVYNNNALCASGILEETNVDCALNVQSLPVSAGPDGWWIDGNSQGCRALHAAFSILNPIQHCPHISFAPQVDPMGNIKCQTSLGVTPNELFNEKDFVFWNEFCTRHGFDPAVGFREIA